ncbi:hypothetical protein GCM10011611_26490 [Aliidongia dinghuensis]|uniref:Lipoprotein n=1 Tax=Aliidongia dinghuensis TaxID=1867774 RepID=A0A8J2YTQ8_9PROT|nr:hypothetical protein [Aliidongia dinghuensis]GGF19284.1 hypothetical protein GCM10011611_26490 [Aliidongia dinghuensis]
MGTRTFRHLVAVCGLLLLTGCATQIDSPQEAYDGTYFAYDKYSARTVVTGKPLMHVTYGLNQTRYLVTSLDGGGGNTTWIDLTEKSEGFVALYFAAHDDQAQLLRVQSLGHDRPHKDEDTYEEVAVYLPPGYLEAHAASGIDIRVEGRNAYTTTTIPALYVQGYLKKLAEVQACVRAKSC